MYSDTNNILMFFIRLFVAINVAIPVYSKIVYRTAATEEDVKSLSTIRPEEALPLIFFEYYKDAPLALPVTLSQVEIQDGRLLSSETEFNSIPSIQQIFFCPSSDENEKCLVPTTFTGSQILQCEREPMPDIEVNSSFGNCGSERNSALFQFKYKLCPSQPPHFFTSQMLTIYAFCYNHSSQKTVFAHYAILSALLLSEPLLKSEQEIEFENLETQTNGKIDPDFYKTLDAENRSLADYEFQKFVPDEHWAFLAYRKTTNHYVNVELQHTALIPLWDEINDYIKKNAVEMFTSPRDVVTGVTRVPDEYLPANVDKKQKYNIWVTVVTDLHGKFDRGVAILMNNFIIKQAGDQPSGSKQQADETSESKQQTDDQPAESKQQTDETSESKQQYIDKLCGQNLCVKSLTDKFDLVNGQVRCCAVNEDITKLFHTKQVIIIEKILQIRGITYTV